MLETDRIAIEECLYVINHIFEYTQNVKNMEDMKHNNMLYDAVQMKFIVLGESATKLSDEIRAALTNVDWRAIKGFRNFVAHDYFGVDENIVWSAIQFHLPQLKADLEKLIGDSE